MNVESGAEVALFPEKEYIKEIFVAVLVSLFSVHNLILHQKVNTFSAKMYASYTKYVLSPTKTSQKGGKP
jgi:hypothetical protein